MNNPSNSGLGNRSAPSDCCEIISDKFDLNSNVQLEAGQVANVTGFVRPVGGVSSGSPYTFNLDSMADYFLQMNSLYIYVKCKVVFATGKSIAEAQKVGLVNGFGLSFFDAIEVSLDGFPVNKGSDTRMPYKNMIETLLSYESDARTTHLKASIFEMDDIDHLENMDPSAAGNNAFKKRNALMKESKVFDFTVPLMTDFTRSDNHLAPGEKLSIKAIQSSNPFLLKSSEDNASYIVKVEDIRLYYNRIRIDPTISANILSTPHRYLSAQTHLKHFTLPSGLSSYNMELYSGPLPRSIVVGQVLTSAYDGSYDKNPFNFQHFNVNHLALKINGQSIPSDGYTPDFENNLISREYTELHVNTGTFRTDRGSCVTMARFKKGCTLFPWDCTYDRCNSNHLHVTRDGLMELSIGWKKPLEKPITILVYACFNQRIVTNYDPKILTPKIEII